MRGYGYGLELLAVVVVAVALGLARREIGGPDLQKPDRRCAYMQSVQIGVTEWMKPDRGLRRLAIEVTEKKMVLPNCLHML